METVKKELSSCWEDLFFLHLRPAFWGLRGAGEKKKLGKPAWPRFDWLLPNEWRI
jgi:hypothetical protein